MAAKRLVVGISGASGVIYGIRLLHALAARKDVETHLVISVAARQMISYEGLAPGDATTEQSTPAQAIAQVEALADHVYPPDELAAPIASGSFDTSGMVVAPCSIKSLAAIANSYAADLLTRAADVTLKEGRPLILMVREAPFHLGHLRLMVQAAELGAIIFPPIPMWYAHPRTLTELVDMTVGRVLARLGIENDLYIRWGE